MIRFNAWLDADTSVARSMGSSEVAAGLEVFYLVGNDRAPGGERDRASPIAQAVQSEDTRAVDSVPGTATGDEYGSRHARTQTREHSSIFEAMRCATLSSHRTLVRRHGGWLSNECTSTV